MKIGIDCRLWNETGVGRYTRNLVLNLAQVDKKNEYSLFATSESEKDLRSTVQGSQFKIIRVDILWHGLAEQVHLPKILNEQKLDLMHFPYFSVPLFYNRQYVVTIHDLIINRFATGRASTLPLPLYFAKRAGYHTVMANAVYRSKRIIVPSNAVKTDLLNTYRKINGSKVEVTYEGGFGKKLKTQNSKLKIEGRYLLRVGNFYPHKNVEGLLLAFREFIYESYENHDVKLVLVGKKDYFWKRIEREISALNIAANVESFENATDADLVYLYENATATIVPSFMEGFSLTAVEAMSTGSPVIVSDIPVHREICADAAIYCNPLDVNDIKQKIDFAFELEDHSRKELIAQGKKQSQKFSWTKMASQTLEIYNSVI